MTELSATTDHSLYIWLVYGLALLTALWLILWPYLKHRRIRRKLKAPTPPNQAT